jgi:nondiscriminating aspartyl-tRNA synthetase
MKEETKRTLIADTPHHVADDIVVQGWVHARRDHGKLIFIDLRDRSGLLQVVAHPRVSEKAHAVMSTLRPECVVSIIGKVKKRPEHLINEKIVSGTVELEVTEVTILAEAETLPFDMGGETLNLELPTLLDHRSLTLRHESVRNIFKIQAAIAYEFRLAAEKLGCTEIFIPTISAGATEGGADVFTVDYYGHKAYMTQSPQLYKQIMVSVLERVFVITKAYRAEPSVTTRHLSEVTMMDIEMAFIQSFEELLDALELVGTSMVQGVVKHHGDVLESFGIENPLIPAKIPRLKMRKAQAIIKERTGRDLSKELDLNPEDEKEICAWAKETHQSDFVTITHYPTKKRAFYTYPDPEDPTYSLSYDLLFKGSEILSGSRRINDHAQLVAAMKSKDVRPESFGMYMQAFKYGMPPEGGFSFGLERFTMKLLALSNVREASLFPRDMERVDERFSIIEKEKTKKVHKEG